MGVKLVQLNRLDEALPHFQQAIQIMPSFTDAYIQVADLLERKGRFADTIATVKSGLPTNRHNPVFANEYAWLLATCPVKELRDSTQAIQISEALARATARKTPEYLDTLAAAYADADRFGEASRSPAKRCLWRNPITTQISPLNWPHVSRSTRKDSLSDSSHLDQRIKNERAASYPTTSVS